MNEEDFEGTLVLERMAELDLIDEFWEAIDSDDLDGAAALMRRAKLDGETISMVLRKMAQADGEH